MDLSIRPRGLFVDQSDTVVVVVPVGQQQIPSVLSSYDIENTPFAYSDENTPMLCLYTRDTTTTSPLLPHSPSPLVLEMDSLVSNTSSCRRPPSEMPGCFLDHCRRRASQRCALCHDRRTAGLRCSQTGSSRWRSSRGLCFSDREAHCKRSCPRCGVTAAIPLPVLFSATTAVIYCQALV